MPNEIFPQHQSHRLRGLSLASKVIWLLHLGTVVQLRLGLGRLD